MGTVQSVEIKRVMLLEDESLLADLAKLNLEKWGIECVRFDNPEMVSEVLNPNHVCSTICHEFDGVITDLDMGTETNGLQFLTKLFFSPCHLGTKPAVLVTGRAEDRWMKDFCQRSAVSFVAKPYSLAALYNGLIESHRQILAGHRRLR